MNVSIPRLTEFKHQPGHPGWFQPTAPDGTRMRPVIQCNCGQYCGIGLHHVHADGRVTASFYHRREADDPNGCEWHVFLTLMDYNGGEFLPAQANARGREEER